MDDSYIIKWDFVPNLVDDSLGVLEINRHDMPDYLEL